MNNLLTPQVIATIGAIVGTSIFIIGGILTIIIFNKYDHGKSK